MLRRGWVPELVAKGYQYRQIHVSYLYPSSDVHTILVNHFAYRAIVGGLISEWVGP